MFKTVQARVGDVSASLEIRSSSPGFDLPDEILIRHAKEAFARTKELTPDEIASATYRVFDHIAD